MTLPWEIVFDYAVPILRIIVTNIMYLAPLRDLRTAVSEGTGLHSLDPTQWAFVMGKCIGWSAYGIITNDWLIYIGEFSGFLIAFWLNLGAVKLQYSMHHKRETTQPLVTCSAESGQTSYDEDKMEYQLPKKMEEGDDDIKMTKGTNDVEGDSNRTPIKFKPVAFALSESPKSTNDNRSRQAIDQRSETLRRWAEANWNLTTQKPKTSHDRLVMTMILSWSLLLSVLGFYSHRVSVGVNKSGYSLPQAVVGYATNITQLFMYGEPLNRIFSVLKTRKSDAIHLPTMVTNIMCSALWMTYGASPKINDPFLFIPNGIGLMIGIIQFVLWLIFRKSKKRRAGEQPSFSLLISTKFLKRIFPGTKDVEFMEATDKSCVSDCGFDCEEGISVEIDKNKNFEHNEVEAAKSALIMKGTSEVKI